MNPVQRKQFILHALEENDLDALAGLICRDSRSLSQLIRFSYDKETLVGWRAILAMGRVARMIAKTDHDLLRVTARKLLWSLSDESGGIGWSAPELLGEIVSADPLRFADLIPLIAEVYDIEERTFRSGVVYALTRIAETEPKSVERFQNILLAALADKDPYVRVRGIWLAGILLPELQQKQIIWTNEHYASVINSLEMLFNDDQVVWIYHNESFIDIRVGDESRNVVCGNG